MITILQDSREQKPLRFSDEVTVEIVALETGDYSIKGHEHLVTVERKSEVDLLGCLGRDRERFWRELARMRCYRLAILLVESDWVRLESGMYVSGMTPESVFGSLVRLAIEHRILIVMAGDHERAGRLCERILRLYARGVERDAAALVGGEGGAAMGRG